MSPQTEQSEFTLSRKLIQLVISESDRLVFICWINFKDIKLWYLLEVTDRLIPVRFFFLLLLFLKNEIRKGEKQRSAVVQSIMKAWLSESDALWYHWLRCVQLWYYPPTLSRFTDNWPQCRSCQTDGTQSYAYDQVTKYRDKCFMFSRLFGGDYEMDQHRYF